MVGPVTARPGRGRALAVLAVPGGVIGLLLGLYVLLGTAGIDGLHLAIAVGALVISTAELAFGYGTAARAPWTSRPLPQALGFGGAIALLLFGILVSLTIPVRTSVSTMGSPMPSGEAVPT